MRVIVLSAQRKKSKKRVSMFCLWFASFFISSACNNIHSNQKKNPTTTLLQGDPATQNNGGAFQLFSVNPDITAPGTVFDMIGQNQEFDTYCGGTLGTCACEYTFIQPGIGPQTISTPVTYQESNLLRCANTVIQGITSFDVRIIVNPIAAGGPALGTTVTPSYNSNTITVSLSANGAFAGSTNFIDLTNPASFVPVQRYQCRSRQFVANPLDPMIIDPIQSTDPSVIYPFNFYTTNVSGSLLRMQQLLIKPQTITATPTPPPALPEPQNFECSLTGSSDGSLQWWANPNVFSAAPCTSAFCNGDASLMYPQDSLSSGKIPVSAGSTANGKRRSSFALSNVPYGVFQIPVQAAVSPYSYVKGTYDVIGYGAKPIPSTGGSSCPTIPIPANATWVKLWNFRATDITAPKIVTGSQSASTAVIACDTSHGQNVFPSCETNYPGILSGGYNGGFGSPLTNPYAGLASRVALFFEGTGTSQTSACYNITKNGWGTAGTSVSDIWQPSNFKFDKFIRLDLLASFPFNLYSNAPTFTPTPIPSPTPNPYEYISNPALVPAGVPQDSQTQLITTPLASDNFTDQLFITTDPNVSDDLMLNESSAVAHFTPRTYRSALACSGPGLCSNVTPLNWKINVKAVGADAKGPDVYPLCVLQFYE